MTVRQKIRKKLLVFTAVALWAFKRKPARDMELVASMKVESARI